MTKNKRKEEKTVDGGRGRRRGGKEKEWAEKEEAEEGLTKYMTFYSTYKNNISCALSM